MRLCAKKENLIPYVKRVSKLRNFEAFGNDLCTTVKGIYQLWNHTKLKNIRNMDTQEGAPALYGPAVGCVAPDVPRLYIYASAQLACSAAVWGASAIV